MSYFVSHQSGFCSQSTAIKLHPWSPIKIYTVYSTFVWLFGLYTLSYCYYTYIKLKLSFPKFINTDKNINNKVNCLFISMGGCIAGFVSFEQHRFISELLYCLLSTLNKSTIDTRHYSCYVSVLFPFLCGLGSNCWFLYVLPSRKLHGSLLIFVDTINTIPWKTGLVAGFPNWKYMEMFLAATMAVVVLDLRGWLASVVN